LSGGTSSGKTTFLNALAEHIPQSERIITIEDAAELKLPGISNLVTLETKHENLDGKGGITMTQLIKTALRMRPDRIIVGEVRGAEALDMINAMNTGHDGSLSTGHANSSKDMLSRLELMILSNMDLPIQSVKKLLGNSIDILIHLERHLNGKRYINSISELLFEDDYKLRVLFQHNGTHMIQVGELVNRVKWNKYETI
jgi:pilus assembly protein CpaF